MRMFDSLAARLLILMTLVPILYASLTESLFAISNADLIFLADRIERREHIDINVLKSAIRVIPVGGELSCRRSNVWPAVTLSIHSLKYDNQATDFEGWSRDVDRAEKIIDDAIICFPDDGNLRLLKASLSFAVGENPGMLCELLKKSVQLAPAEADVMVGRINLWMRVSNATRENCHSLFVTDLTVGLRYLSIENLAVGLSGARAEGLEDLDGIAAGVDHGRARIRKALRADVSKLL